MTCGERASTIAVFLNVSRVIFVHSFGGSKIQKASFRALSILSLVLATPVFAGPKKEAYAVNALQERFRQLRGVARRWCHGGAFDDPAVPD
jgi:hypothetical protein